MSLIHPLAFVDPEAVIGDGTRVGAFAVIGAGVVLGRDNEVRAHVVIEGPGVTVGDRNIFSPGAVIGAPAQDKKPTTITPQLLIGDDNLFREHVTAHRGTEYGGGITRIGSNNLLMVGCHVAHDCDVRNNVILANGVLLAGHVLVEDFAVMNGASAIHHFGTVGTLSYVGGLTRLVHDVPPYMVVEGHPAKVKKVNSVGMTRRGIPQERIDLLQRAFRHVFHRRHKGEPLKERFERLDHEGITSPEIDKLREFMVAQAGGRNGRAQERFR